MKKEDKSKLVLIIIIYIFLIITGIISAIIIGKLNVEQSRYLLMGVIISWIIYIRYSVSIYKLVTKINFIKKWLKK